MSNNTSLYGTGSLIPAGDNVIITGTLTVNGCAILTDCSTFNLLPFNATTVNVGGSATTLALGATTGVTTIRNQLATANYDFPVSDGTANQVLITDGAGNLSFANVQSLDTNYTIQADTVVGGANLTLAGSDATTDSVKFASAGGTTVSRTDASTITISSLDTNTTYTQNASVATGGADLNLVGSDATTDTIKFAGGTNVTITATDANTITIDAPDTNTTYTQNISATSGGANLNLVGSDATTDTVKFADGTGVTVAFTDANTATISIGQPVGTADSPSFNGATLGDITVGVVTDDTITTNTNALYINSAITTNTQIYFGNDADVLEYGFSSPANPAVYTDHFINGNLANNLFNTTTNSVVQPLRIGAPAGTAITPAVGYGVGMLAEIDNAAGTLKQAGEFNFSWTDATAATEDAKFEIVLLRNGTSTVASSLDSNGNLELAGGITVSGALSGSSTFNPPGSGATLVYTLPGAAGAASTVLTNDGTGLLSWALPGGGGSTFGNITIAVDTNNTISTTTGDLILQTQAGVNSGVITIEAGAGNDVVIEPNGAGRVLLTTDSVVVGDLNASANITTNGTGNLYLNTNGFTNSGNMFMEAGINGNIVLEPNATGTGAVKTYNDFIVDDDVLFVDVSTKKIGINTITPAYDLDVDGDIKVGGDTIYNSFDEKLIEYSQAASIYGTSRQANFQATNNIGVRASYVFIDGNVEYNTNTLTTSATTPDQVLSFWDQTTIEAVKSTIKVVSGGAVQCIEVLMVQDGTTISLNTYGDVRTAGNLTTVSSGYNAITGYWELRVTPVNAVTTYAVTNQIMY